jgi:hypothetical protein
VYYGYAGNNIRLTGFFCLTIILSLIAACIFYPVEKMSIKISGEICKYALGGKNVKILK